MLTLNTFPAANGRRNMKTRLEPFSLSFCGSKSHPVFLLFSFQVMKLSALIGSLKKRNEMLLIVLNRANSMYANDTVPPAGRVGIATCVKT